MHRPGSRHWERWTTPGRGGHEQLVGGIRLDIRARDEHGRLVIVERSSGRPITPTSAN